MAFQQPPRLSLQRVLPPAERRDSTIVPNRSHHHPRPHHHCQQQPAAPTPSGSVPAAAAAATMAESFPTAAVNVPQTMATAAAAAAAAAAAHSPSVDDSHDPRTWVLFEPASDFRTASGLSDDVSLLTPGRSRFSEPGSERRVVGWGELDGYSYDEDEDVIIDDEGEDDGDGDGDDDDAELDSLDSHLPEFRAGTLMYHHHRRHNDSPNHVYGHGHGHGHNRTFSASTPNLSLPSPCPQMPAHDGLGSFRIYQPGTSMDVQEQIYAHERYNTNTNTNARRLRRRLENEAIAQEAVKMQRIEAWRLEQSRILLDEIQKLASRRRRAESQSRGASSRASSLRRTSSHPVLSSREEDSMAWHDEDAPDAASTSSAGGPHEEGFWTKITKRVIRDVMGINDRLLAILFGETLPGDDEHLVVPSQELMAAETESESRWHLHILERVATELGMLVNHLSHHPGAFSTYVRMQQAPLPYAGLPVIPETGAEVADEEAGMEVDNLPQRRRRQQHAPASNVPVVDSLMTAPHSPQFRPSMPRRPSYRHDHDDHHHHHNHHRHITNSHPTTTPSSAVFTQEEWEQDLDLKLVFRYLRSRFSSSASTSTPAANNTTTTTPAQDTAAKSARVRQHHPLIGRTRISKSTTTTTTNLLSHAPPPPSIISPTGTAARRTTTGQQSCRSQSSRRSGHQNQGLGLRRRRSSGSSRHYWDLGGSVASGSAIASTGPMGSWGEV